MKKFLALFMLAAVIVVNAQVLTISEVRTKNSMDSVNVEGVVYSPDFNLSSTSSNSYYIYDSKAGINVFIKGGKKTLALGDKIRIGGHVEFYQNLTEVVGLSTNVTVLSSNNALPVAKEFSLADTVNGENFEGQYVVIRNIYKVLGAWPASGKDANNLYINTDKTAKTGMTMRIDKDIKISATEPTWPKDIKGVIVQFGKIYQINPIADADFTTPNAVEDTKVKVNTYSLSQNYPNPFNPSTKITFSLAKASNVKVTVYNIMGQEVATLLNGFRAEGTHTVNFNAANLNSGMYFCKMQADNFKSMIKMMLVK